MVATREETLQTGILSTSEGDKKIKMLFQKANIYRPTKKKKKKKSLRIILGSLKLKLKVWLTISEMIRGGSREVEKWRNKKEKKTKPENVKMGGALLSTKRTLLS